VLQVTTNKLILVGTMADAVHCYSLQGTKQYSLYMPASIRAMQLLTPSQTRSTKCVVVALSNGALRTYNDKTLVSEHTSSSPVSGLFVGRYAREDNSLVNVTAAGGLDIKVRCVKLRRCCSSCGTVDALLQHLHALVTHVPLGSPAQICASWEGQNHLQGRSKSMHCSFTSKQRLSSIANDAS
jgi:hypothetical protein